MNTLYTALLAAVLAFTAPRAALAAGQLDSGYGIGGYLADPPGDADVDYHAFDVAADGSMLATGVAQADCAVAAINADGRPDPGFADDGILRFACRPDLHPAVLRQADGKVLLTYAAGQQSVAIARLNADASPDGSFGAGGVVNVDVSGRLYGTARMLITADGGVWAVATGDSAFAVRTGSDGQTREVSALTGAWYPDPENPFDLRGLIAGGDGMMTAVLAGYRLCGLPTCAFQSHGLTFVHFFADGRPPGTSRWNWEPGWSPPPAVEVVGPYVYAAFYDDNEGRTVVRRYASSGEDWSFGRYGSLGLEDAASFPRSLAVDSSARLYLFGTFPGCGNEPDVCMVRHGVAAYLPAGSIAGEFGQGGKSGVDYGSVHDLRALRVAPAGRLLAVAGAPGQLGAARLDLGPGTSPGRIGLLERTTSRDAGHLVGSSNGSETTIHERSTTLIFRVARSGGDRGAVSVRYRISGDDRASGAYLPASGALDWPSGDASDREIPLVLQADPRLNDGGVVRLTLEAPAGGASLGTAVHVVRILDAAAGRVAFGGPYELSGTEGATVIVPVGRTGGGTGAVSVRVRPVLSAASGAAASANDLASTDTVTITWADGETGYKAFKVGLVDDSQDEPEERFTLELSDATGGAIIGVASVSVTITDNDVAQAGSGPAPAGGGGGSLRWLDLLLLAGLGAALRSRTSRGIDEWRASPGGAVGQRVNHRNAR